jgi:hypothetical protein
VSGMPVMDRIVLVNRSSVADAAIANIIPALQAQVTHDFAPIWGIEATIGFTPKGVEPEAGSWELAILDHTDIEDAGGYHVDQNGRVSGKAFWLDAIEANEAPSVDVSHELLEMLADPSAGTDPTKFVSLGNYRGGGYECLREVCDAVESDALGYTHPGADGKPVPLSDFVLPEYFGGHSTARVPGLPAESMDFMGHLTAAAPALLPDGYLGLREPDGTWTMVSDFAMRPTGRHQRSKRRMLWGLRGPVAA